MIQANAFAFNTSTRSLISIQRTRICNFLFHLSSQPFHFIHKNSKMISTKKLQKLARKWQKLAAIKRKRIALPETERVAETSTCSTSTKAEKGHFVVYSADKKRFVLPLHYLHNEMMRELFDMAAEEFGWSGDGPLTLPCDAELMQYAAALIRENVGRDVQKALLTSIARTCASFHLQHQPMVHQIPIYSF